MGARKQLSSRTHSSLAISPEAMASSMAWWVARSSGGPRTGQAHCAEAEAPRKLAGDALGLDVAHAGEADADVAREGALLGAQGGVDGPRGPVGEGRGGGAEHLFELGAEAAGVEGAAELEGDGAGAGGIARVVKVVKVVGVVGVVLLVLVLLGVEGEHVEEDEDGGGGAKGAAGVASRRWTAGASWASMSLNWRRRMRCEPRPRRRCSTSVPDMCLRFLAIGIKASYMAARKRLEERARARPCTSLRQTCDRLAKVVPNIPASHV